MYQASAPYFANTLRNLSTILDKAQAHADARKVESTVFTMDRLYPDMFTMARQVQIACDAVKGAMARLAGVDIPKHDDVEQTFADLKARIAKTVSFIETFKPAQIDGTEDKNIAFKIGGHELKFTGMQYLLGFVYSNFYFHVTTTYNILRHNGVDIGKNDFLGKI
ncbi:MAG: DUF1993 family protein [Betaproteobacteria bacterium]|nr:DUF1993 family protein [Betaproteobacteria bacterium]